MRLLFNQNLWIILLTATLFACSGDDESETGERSTDPIIGTWRNVDDDYIQNYTFTSNGTLNGSSTSETFPEDNRTFMGLWSNNGTDLTSTTQQYTINIEGQSSVVIVSFSNNFNSLTFSTDGGVYNKQ